MPLETFMDEPVQKTMRICSKCKELKPLTPEYFFKFHLNPLGFANRCKECALTQVNKSRKKSPARTSFATKRSSVKRDGRYKWGLGKAKTPEAEAYIEYLETITHCPDCAKEVEWFGKMGNPYAASYDRIDSDGDYTKENVRIVCRDCNTQKSFSPVDEWVGLLEVRVKKGIIKEVDPALVEYIIENKKEE